MRGWEEAQKWPERRSIPHATAAAAAERSQQRRQGDGKSRSGRRDLPALPEQWCRAADALKQRKAVYRAGTAAVQSQHAFALVSDRPPMAQQRPHSAGEVIEVLDAPKDTAAGSGVLARLAAREGERTSAAARRLEELQVTGDPRESVDGFMDDFSSRRQALEAALQEAAGSGGGDAAAMADLAARITELEQAGAWMCG